MKKILIIFILFSLLCFGKDYSIGETINLKIQGDISKEQIEKAFDTFKDLKISKSDDSYIVSFKSYTVGEKTIDLGSKKLSIDIKSSLIKEDKNIYDKLENSKNMFIEKDYPYASIGSGVISLILLITGISLLIIKRKRDPFNIFNKNLKKTTQDNWSENISYSLRDYIDRVYKTNFLNGKYVDGILNSDELKLLNDLDYIKFSRNKDSDYKDYEKKTIAIVERLRKERKDD